MSLKPVRLFPGRSKRNGQGVKIKLENHPQNIPNASICQDILLWNRALHWATRHYRKTLQWAELECVKFFKRLFLLYFWEWKVFCVSWQLRFVSHYERRYLTCLCVCHPAYVVPLVVCLTVVAVLLVVILLVLFKKKRKGRSYGEFPSWSILIHSSTETNDKTSWFIPYFLFVLQDQTSENPLEVKK